MTLSGVSALGLFLIARRDQPPALRHRTMSIFVLAAVLILAVQVVTAQWAPVTIIIQSQIIRAGILVMIFGYVYFADYLARAYQAGRGRADWAALVGSYWLSALPIAPLAVWGVQRLVNRIQLRRLLSWGIVAELPDRQLLHRLHLRRLEPRHSHLWPAYSLGGCPVLGPRSHAA